MKLIIYSVKKNIFKNLASMSLRLEICHLAVIPLRENPSHKAQMISQLLFGQLYCVILNQNNWLQIKVIDDGYEGWIANNQHQNINKIDVNKLQNFLPRLACQAFTKVFNPNKTIIFHLPFGSNLYFIEEALSSFNGVLYPLNAEDYILPNKANSIKDIEKYARLFLNVPYLWGGKTHFGIDCSGFSQQVFKVLGIQLHRDAWQQAQQGEDVGFLELAQKGDLAFFDNDEGRITHVGILLNNHQIIHASGSVKIDKIDSYGIFCDEQKIYTHKLRILKRYI